MGEVRQYLTGRAIRCLVMAAFGVGIFVIGYQDPSFGRVATIVVLLLASVALFVASKRLGSRG